MNELCNQACDFRALPLRGHMAGLVHSDEPELSILSNVSGKVSICGPISIRLSNLEACVLDPILSSIGWHRAICGTRVMHQLVLVLHLFVNPL